MKPADGETKMTIQNRELNRRLTNLEDCAREAPEGAYDDVKATTEAIGDIANNIMQTLRAVGLKAPGDDSLRDIEAAIYGYILRNNPDAYGLIAGEGFGEHVNGPARQRILATAAANVEFFRSLRS